MNPEKTQGGRLVGAINCQADMAFEQMMDTKKQFGKTDKRQGYHIILSFKEDEVEPDRAFEITQKFVAEYLGDAYEAVFVVHDNTDHVHSHIVFNTVSSEDVEVDRRYLITTKGAKPDYLLPVKFFDENAGYDAFAPRESIRIKKSGNGLNFVHGGISLQEMVVPVVDYTPVSTKSKAYKRNAGKYDTKPVELNLLSANRKIVNMSFILNFYQKDAVSDNRSQANYLLYFTDSNGVQISDTQKIIADKVSTDGQDRTFRCSFNLKSQAYSKTESYYLNIVEESNEVPPQKEEFHIDIAFAVDSFDFFS